MLEWSPAEFPLCTYIADYEWVGQLSDGPYVPAAVSPRKLATYKRIPHVSVVGGFMLTMIMTTSSQRRWNVRMVAWPPEAHRVTRSLVEVRFSQRGSNVPRKKFNYFVERDKGRKIWKILPVWCWQHTFPSAIHRDERVCGTAGKRLIEFLGFNSR